MFNYNITHRRNKVVNYLSLILFFKSITVVDSSKNISSDPNIHEIYQAGPCFFRIQTLLFQIVSVNTYAAVHSTHCELRC